MDSKASVVWGLVENLIWYELCDDEKGYNVDILQYFYKSIQYCRIICRLVNNYEKK